MSMTSLRKTTTPAPSAASVSRAGRGAAPGGRSSGPVKRRTPIVRVLPILIFCGVLMLSVRVTDLFLGLTGLGPLSVAELQAQQTSNPPPPPAVPAPPPAPLAVDPNEGRTPTELDVLEKLRERHATLDARERDIDRREDTLRAAESQIDRKIAEMRTLQSTIEGLLRQYNDQEDNKMRSLVKIYENMKPKEAAKIFEQLDMSILLEVLERMKEQKVAPILAEMDPMKAKSVTAEMAQRRQMPAPSSTPGSGAAGKGGAG